MTNGRPRATDKSECASPPPNSTGADYHGTLRLMQKGHSTRELLASSPGSRKALHDCSAFDVLHHDIFIQQIRTCDPDNPELCQDVDSFANQTTLRCSMVYHYPLTTIKNIPDDITPRVQGVDMFLGKVRTFSGNKWEDLSEVARFVEGGGHVSGKRSISASAVWPCQHARMNKQQA